ncbi:MAG: MFS transporter, partial [Alphaproteobacteria bacterium]|nr:MFS transporter [Alphaproteobacteria bacterium]
KRPDGALERINAVLRRFSHPQLAALPPPDQDQRKASIVDILKGVYLQRTLLLTLSYGFTVMALYYILKWVPKIVVDMGHKPNEAAGVLTYANLGGVVGGLVLGPLIHRFGIKWPTIGMLAGSMVMISLFGYDNDRTTLGMWSLSTAACQFFTNAAVAGFYLAFVASYPTHARATATGFGIGVGRLGAWLSPMFAGLLFKANYSLAVVSLIMSCTSLVALLCLLPLRFEKR